jgi:hypothetical protein
VKPQPAVHQHPQPAAACNPAAPAAKASTRPPQSPPGQTRAASPSDAKPST